MTQTQQKTIDLILAERRRQEEKFGEQNHDLPVWMLILGEEYGELQEAILESGPWKGIHPELGGYDNVLKEATHVAAVAVQILEYLQRCGSEK